MDAMRRASNSKLQQDQDSHHNSIISVGDENRYRDALNSSDVMFESQGERLHTQEEPAFHPYASTEFRITKNRTIGPAAGSKRRGTTPNNASQVASQGLDGVW